ncbi:hypothetical protein [Bdellovibrio bacteriovorus]|uniref:hypothetical protein n=1 Tax=Bdellovibrio bacteriovorus TaxID=959 RepID=UPI0035A6CCBF
MKQIFLSLIAASFFALPVSAHEGHDHDGPAMVQAPKGGVIKSLEEVHVEVVSKGKDIKVYLYNKDLKPADASQFKIKLKAELPRSKKTEELTYKTEAHHLEASFDAKGAHRYNLIVLITDAKQGHEDKLTFTVEPRK